MYITQTNIRVYKRYYLISYITSLLRIKTISIEYSGWEVKYSFRGKEE